MRREVGEHLEAPANQSRVAARDSMLHLRPFPETLENKLWCPTYLLQGLDNHLHCNSVTRDVSSFKTVSSVSFASDSCWERENPLSPPMGLPRKLTNIQWTSASRGVVVVMV